MFLVGCSNSKVLYCEYSGNYLIYGENIILDSLEFKNDKLKTFKRKNTVNVYSNYIDNLDYIYKLMKIEGKIFKRSINGSKYNISRNSSSVVLTLSLNFKNNTNLNNLGFNVNSSYDELIKFYEEKGFVCE